MTTLQRTVKRETGRYYRGRPLIIELHPGYCSIREKGRRAAVSVDYAAVFELGWKILARERQAEKKAAAKRKGGR